MMTAVTKHMSDASFQLYCARRYLGKDEEEHMINTWSDHVGITKTI